jgi:crotonobetainyl-CoA:carnitine CoA-transferase CaiB-like acyl-CoA transferase
VRSDALSHLLDLSRVLAGPWASQVLADLGAEVIKVERPGAGDETRAWGPPWLRDAQGAETRESAYFASTNRGKKSITLDLARPEGQAIARRLAGAQTSSSRTSGSARSLATASGSARAVSGKRGARGIA